jgi:prepilin-type N-terminal cleavage/methylation domain-containing protein
MKKNGFTLIEIIIALAAGVIVMLTVAMLVQSGYRSWNQAYNAANAGSRLDSIATTTSFGTIGRKSNKNDYYVYHVAGSTFTRVTPVANPEENLTGQAVEFRYWGSDLEDDMLTPTSVADKYALFYLDGGQLKLDLGTSTGGPTGGAIDAAGHRVASTSTSTLANHVTSVAFTHTTKNLAGDGWGCVRMRLEINDPVDNKSKTVIAATYIRNVWPQ